MKTNKKDSRKIHSKKRLEIKIDQEGIEFQETTEVPEKRKLKNHKVHRVLEKRRSRQRSRKRNEKVRL
jgi:hypothetical protein